MYHPWGMQPGSAKYHVHIVPFRSAPGNREQWSMTIAFVTQINCRRQNGTPPRPQGSTVRHTTIDEAPPRSTLTHACTVPGASYVAKMVCTGLGILVQCRQLAAVCQSHSKVYKKKRRRQAKPPLSLGSVTRATMQSRTTGTECMQPQTLGWGLTRGLMACSSARPRGSNTFPPASVETPIIPSTELMLVVVDACAARRTATINPESKRNEEKRLGW